LASRRSAEDYIHDGRVTVNGKRVTKLGKMVDESHDVVRVDGKQVRLSRKKVYVLLNKPKGYITTVSDELGRKNVFDIVHVRERIYPVGRLDRNSEGLLLLTNDGEMTNRLLHPSRRIHKTYRAKLNRPFDEQDFEPLVTGLQLEDGKTAPCRARYYTQDPTMIELEIHEGKKHIVRRMFSALGYNVKALKRTQFGPLDLKGLARGQWRLLSPTEVFRLRKAAGLVNAEN